MKHFSLPDDSCNIPMIAGNYIDHSVCDEIIDYFEYKWTMKTPGIVSDQCIVDPTRKNSLDAILRGPLRKLYFQELIKVIDDYKFQFPMVQNHLQHWGVVEDVNIQKYEPFTGGYHDLHCENAGKDSSERVLVFMTYLNDVEEGGETIFPLQNFKCKPEKGLTLIWPAYFSYLHKGLVSTQTKYIATGWLSYI
jgi:prolyl 4-hydroxylase